MCKHFNACKETCGRGLPVAGLYVRLVCSRMPEKCPLYISLCSNVKAEGAA